jgi:hypothetical protein
MKLFPTFQAILLVAVLGGCATHKSNITGSIDPAEKTISVPPGSLGILGPVKRKLVVNGWTIDEFDQADTRYKFALTTVRTQLLCLVEWSEVSYEIVLLDKKARREVFQLSGESCDSYSDVADEFEKAIKAAESRKRN